MRGLDNYELPVRTHHSSLARNASVSCGFILNIIILLCELVFHILIFVFLPNTGSYDFNYNEKLKNAVLSFSIINSVMIIVSLKFILCACCCSTEHIIIIFILIKLIFTIIEFCLNLGIIGQIRKIEKKYDYSESSIYETFISVLLLLIASLFTNIIELIISLCDIGDCNYYCCDCYCCRVHFKIHSIRTKMVNYSVESSNHIDVFGNY